MPTADPTNVLFKIAHPDLYERNPFNVLNLPINASVKDICRRKEDIEAAFEAGTEAEEFKHVLPLDEHRKPPTRQAVDDAFAALEDPETRIAYTLFWFWPKEPGRKTNNPNRELAEWIASCGGDLDANVAVDVIFSPLLGRHNASIMHHMQALAAEFFLFDYPKPPYCMARFVTDTRNERNHFWHSVAEIVSAKHWMSAVNFWNAIVSDTDFWHSVSEKVSARNDPRLDDRFVQSLRDQFAFAFDQINVELAIDFAKAGHKSNARRQIEYMKLSQPDADDVEGTLGDAFSGLLRQTEAVCKTARSEAEKNRTDGLHQANLILKQTNETLLASRIILAKGTVVRNAIATTIVSAVRKCLMEYGNITTNWDGCLKLCEKLESVAETPGQEKLVAEGERIFAEKKKAKEEEKTCWFCKKEKGDPALSIEKSLYGEVKRDLIIRRRITWKTIVIKVPRCAKCKKYHDQRPRVVFILFACILVPLGSIIGGLCFYSNNPMVYSAVVPAVAMSVGGMLGLSISLIAGVLNKQVDVSRYPPYSAMKKQGYVDGAKPPKRMREGV